MNFQLYLIGGGDNGYIDMLKDFATTNDLLNQIHFLGYRNDINDILQDMHVGIMASRCEAFGRVTVEYMNASIPVIATDSGGSPEIVHDNISGFIYKQGDYEDLAKIIEHIIASPNIITTLGYLTENSVAVHLWNASWLDDLNEYRKQSHGWRKYWNIIKAHIKKK